MTVSVGSTITTASYNTIFSEISNILNSSVGGYGPNIRTASTATDNIIAESAHWAALYSDVNNSIKHQTGANIPGATPPAVGNLITAAFVNTLAAAATTAVANSLTVHASQLATSTSSTTFTDLPWNSQVQNVTDYTWQTESQVHYHFNLGGSIRSTIDYSGTVGSVGDQGFLEFVGHANNPGYSTLITNPYSRTRWIGPFSTTVTNYSTSTSAGIFTATVTYVRSTVGVGINNVEVTTEVFPPTGAGTISLLPISNNELFYSTDAIKAIRPSVVTDRKILETSTLQSFNFSAGTRSNPQILTLSNTGGEPVLVSNVFATSFGVIGYAISTATNLTDPNPVIIPLSYPITIAPNDDYNVVVYYLEPVRSTTEVGKFYNSIIITSDSDDRNLIVSTEQNVSAPEFDFNLLLTDPSQQYTYDNWQNEFGLSGSDKTLGINIANTYYLSNTDFGVIDGKRRFGLFRKPDANGLKGWVDYTKASLGGDYTLLTSIFFRGVDAGGTDNSRALTANKFFDPGYGYGDFYDKTLVNLDLSSSVAKRYQYNIEPYFGSLNASLNFPGYTVSLSNQEFNGAPSEEAAAAFSVVIDGWPGTGSILRGPSVIFSPLAVNNVGAYSADLTVTVTATDLTGAIVTKSKTINLSLNMITLVDGNLVKWLSGFETDNAVIGMSYDRIGGTTYLTVGVGSGADGAPGLSGNDYLPTYVDVNQLGIAGDERWGTFPIGYGMPMYRISYGGSWSGFMNTYAVWPRNPSWNGGYSPPMGIGIGMAYKFTAASTGEYTVEFAADDYGNVSIDGQLVIEGGGFRGSSSNTFNINSIGEHTVALGVINNVGYRGNPGGIAVTIRNPAGNIVWSTLDAVRSTPPYLYWPEVYRIPIESNVVRTYQLSQYRVKDFAPVNDSSNYGAYFGTPATASAGSILTVDSDGKGNLTFNWNPQNTTSGTGADTTLANISSLQYAYSYFASRKRNVDGAVGGQTTQRLTGMTIRNPRYTTVIAPGFGRIEVQSTVYENNINGTTSSLKINGSEVGYSYSRGHTLAVINPLTLAVESMNTYDTYGTGESSALTSALNNVASGKIIAILSYDATSLDQGTRDVLVSKFSSSLGAVWGQSRIAHSFVGRAGFASFSPVERISDSSNLVDTYTVWPSGPVGESIVGGGGGGGGDCFTAETLVTMSDGTTKRIDEVLIGDYVLSGDGKSFNVVEYIEELPGTVWPKLYAPKHGMKAFATINHPMYVDGQWTSASPVNMYPWVDCVHIEPPVVVESQHAPVYNLWVTGDSTYWVNGFVTHSLIGDGGFIRKAIQRDLITHDLSMSAIGDFAMSTPAVSYGAYLLNRAASNITIVHRPLAWCLQNKLATSVLKQVCNIVGSIAIMYRNK